MNVTIDAVVHDDPVIPRERVEAVKRVARPGIFLGITGTRGTTGAVGQTTKIAPFRRPGESRPIHR
jgi:hypothetical protein